MTTVTRLLLSHFPVERWRTRRKENVRHMHRLLDGVRGLLVLRPDGDEECPFSCVCVFDSGSLREHVRQALIEARIYPAVLWPLSTPVFPDPVEHVELSTRFLSIHADARSDSEDIEHVANASRRAVEGFRT